MTGFVCIVAPLLALAGCGSQVSRAEVPPTAPAPRSAPSVTAAPVPAGVTIEDFEYVPAEIEVPRGTRVTWTNEDVANHTVTFADGIPEGLPNLRQDRSGTVRASAAGAFPYVCDFHPSMRGTLTVR